jgi:hypothetical protein
MDSMRIATTENLKRDIHASFFFGPGAVCATQSRNLDPGAIHLIPKDQYESIQLSTLSTPISLINSALQSLGSAQIAAMSS